MPNAEEILNKLINLIPKPMKLRPKLCIVYIDRKNKDGAGTKRTQLPEILSNSEKMSVQMQGHLRVHLGHIC